MADCSFARCQQERRLIKRELMKWSKDMLHIVGEWPKMIYLTPDCPDPTCLATCAVPARTIQLKEPRNKFLLLFFFYLSIICISLLLLLLLFLFFFCVCGQTFPMGAAASSSSSALTHTHTHTYTRSTCISISAAFLLPWLYTLVACQLNLSWLESSLILRPQMGFAVKR